MAKAWSERACEFHEAMKDEPELAAYFEAAERLKTTLVWTWQDSPDVFYAFNEGGDEEIVVLVPPSIEWTPAFLQEGHHSKRRHETQFGDVYVTHH